MNLSAQKISLIDWLIHLQNEKVIAILENIRSGADVEIKKKTLAEKLLEAPTITNEEVSQLELTHKWINEKLLLPITTNNQ